MKMNLLKAFTCLLVIIFCIGAAKAQDVIFKKNKEQINAKVLEIGLDAIRYQPFEGVDGPIISIALEEVWKIKFEKGSEWINSADPYSVSRAVEVRDKSRAIKFEFLSPLFGKLAFGYEQMIKVGINLEFKVGLIGPSVSNEISRDNPRGGFFKAGTKFLFGSEYVVRGMKHTHQLYGKYFKPEIIFSTFEKDYRVASSTYYNTKGRFTTTSYGINLVFGKQSIVGNAVTIDWYIGIGYGGQSSGIEDQIISPNEHYDNFDEYCFSHAYSGPDFPLIYTAGIAIGILMK